MSSASVSGRYPMKFGQYELLERVAVGGMAEVYRGRAAGAEGFEKWVAIKRILPEYAKDDRFISMMLTEARIHSALSHRNIVQIHDLGISEDGEYFIVLEYVEGHDLRAVMEAAADLRVQIPDALALHIADELAQALHFAHELKDPNGQPLGIIHRDVSPSNVLISNSGEVKLSDFGIAKRRHDHSVVGSLKGNMVYMSPEQARRGPLDRRTDVFSLGAVLFEMLTGQKLREITDEANGFREVASGVVRSARALRPDLPEAYEVLLAKALAAEPADRFQDAAAFGNAIRALRRESDAPVGPADMKELIELLAPPRRARSPVERSKVIRLGPEFRMLAVNARGTRGTGATEASDNPLDVSAPPPLAPGVVPAAHDAPGSNGNGGPVWAEDAARLATATPDPTSQMGSMAPTPPPPLLPSRPVANPTAGHTSPAEFARAIDMQATPPPPLRPPDRTSALKTPSPVAPPIASTIPAPSVDAAAGPHPNYDSMLTPPPPILSATPGPPSGPSTGTPWSPPSSASSDLASTESQHRTPLGPDAVVLYAGPSMNRDFVPSAAPTTAEIKRDRRPRRGRSVAVASLAILAAGAAVVHYKFIPLDVVVAWPRPAWLAVSSDPPGAAVKLDGRTLPDPTPTRIEVKRDTGDHVLELTHTGSRSVRTTIRFDRSVVLAQAISLPAEPPAPPAAPPVEPTEEPIVVPSTATKPLASEATRPATKAEKKAEKRADKQAAKLAAKQSAKKKSKKKMGRKGHKKKGADTTETAELRPTD